jgi:hypothetical protein
MSGRGNGFGVQSRTRSKARIVESAAGIPNFVTEYRSVENDTGQEKRPASWRGAGQGETLGMQPKVSRGTERSGPPGGESGAIVNRYRDMGLPASISMPGLSNLFMRPEQASKKHATFQGDRSCSRSAAGRLRRSFPPF